MTSAVQGPLICPSITCTICGRKATRMGAMSAFILYIFVLADVFPAPFSVYLFPITIIALVGMLVESLPLKDVDNITVTLVAVLLGHLLF